jgi:predicted hydrocarbon binding protein
MGYNIGVTMGKLTIADANELLNKGVITQETLAKMQQDGLVSTRTKRAERYMQSENGNWVTPIFYFRGLNGGKYTLKITELRAKLNEVIEKFTVTKHEVDKEENNNRKNSKGKKTK